MKTNSWLTSSLAIYVAGFTVAVAAQPATSTHSKKVKPKEAAAKPAPTPKPSPAPALQNGPAEITQEHVNIRARADVDSEVVAHFGRKDVVEVVEEVIAKKAEPGEPSRWAKIAWPKNTPVWVYGDFIDKASGEVKSTKLNLRGGPGENYSVVGQLNKGDTIKKLDAKGDWLKIEAPANCYAFVAASLVKSKPASEAAPAPSAPLTALRPPTSVQPRPAPSGGALPPTTTTVVPNDVVVTYPKPAAVPTFTLPPPQPPRPTPSGTPPALAGVSAPAPSVIAVPPPPQPAAPKVTRAAETKPTVATAPPALTREPGEIDFQPQREETFVKRVVTREGRVRRSYNIQAPTPLLLENLHNGRVMNYLYSTSTNLNLGAYRGRVVTLTGEEALDERWPNTPVIRVETLQTEP